MTAASSQQQARCELFNAILTYFGKYGKAIINESGTAQQQIHSQTIKQQLQIERNTILFREKLLTVFKVTPISTSIRLGGSIDAIAVKETL